MAQMAYEEKTGARALVSVMERVLLPYEKKLPSTSIPYLVVTADIVGNPHGELATIVAEPDDPQRLAAYTRMVAEEKKGILQLITIENKQNLESYPLVFSPQRLELIVDHHLRTGFPLDAILDEGIMLYNQVRVFESDFYESQGFRIHFNEEAINEIIEQSLRCDKTASAICRSISKDYDYGFRLIADKSGQTQFILPRKAVVHPNDYLDELIRATCNELPLDFRKKSRQL
jgi:hypothetical protein